MLLGFPSLLRGTFIQGLTFSTFSFHSHSFQILLLSFQSTFPKGYFIFLASHLLYFLKKISLQMLSLLHTDTQNTRQYLWFSGQIISGKTRHSLTTCMRFTQQGFGSRSRPWARAATCGEEPAVGQQGPVGQGVMWEQCLKSCSLWETHAESVGEGRHATEGTSHGAGAEEEQCRQSIMHNPCSPVLSGGAGRRKQIGKRCFQFAFSSHCNLLLQIGNKLN